MKLRLQKPTRLHVIAIILTVLVSLITGSVVNEVLTPSQGGAASGGLASALRGKPLGLNYVASLLDSTLFLGVLSLLMAMGLVYGHAVANKLKEDEFVGGKIHASLGDNSMYAFAFAFLLVAGTLLWAQSQGFASLKNLMSGFGQVP